MNIKLLKEKLMNIINSIFGGFGNKKNIEDVCDDKDIITIITNDLEKISKKWSINFHGIIHGVESIIDDFNNTTRLNFRWDVVSTEIKVDEKLLKPLKYKVILNLPVSDFSNNGGKLTLKLEYWKHRPENVYAGDNEGMVRYDILLNGNSKICGNTDLKNPKQIIDGVEKVLYNSYN